MPIALPKLPSGSARRRIVVVATALACLVATDLVIRHYDAELASFYWDAYGRKRDTLLRLSPKPHIVLFGCSRTNYGLDPEEIRRVTGLRAFNLGLEGSKVIEWQFIAKDSIAQVRPSLVVLGVNASAIRADYLPVPAARQLFTFHDLLDYCWNDGWSNEVVGHYLLWNWGQAWALHHRRYGVKMIIQEQLACILPKYAQEAIERRTIAGRKCPPNGYEHPWLYGRRKKTLESLLAEEPDRVLLRSVPMFSPDCRTTVHFEDLLCWFNEQRIPLLVAYIPNSPRTEERWKPVEPAMIAAIESICRRQGIAFLPCDQADLPRTNADYLEELHAALPLARRISRRVAEQLVALGMVEPPQQPQLAGTIDAEADAR